MNKSTLSIQAPSNVGEPAGMHSNLKRPSRAGYFLRVYWLGRLLLLAGCSLLLAMPFGLLFPVFVWETHAAMGVIVSSLLLSPWFGLGQGGLLGLRLTARRSWRMILRALLAAVIFAFCVAFAGSLLSMFYGQSSFAEMLAGTVFSFLSALGAILPSNPFFELQSMLVAPISIGLHAEYGLFILVHALAEELLFRGIPLIVLAERFGWATAISISSVAFASVHLMHLEPGLLGLLNLLILAVILAVTVLQNKSLWFACVFHAAWNLLAVFKLALPMGGMVYMAEKMNFTLPEGDASFVWWYELIMGPANSGAESGLLMTVLLLLLGYWLLPRLEHWADPVLSARGFQRRLLESRMRAALFAQR